MDLEEKKLNQRFVSDYNLPIQVVQGIHFFHRLILFENDYNSLTKYNNLKKVIKEKFDDNSSKFLEYYHEVRDKIITDTISLDEYKSFNEAKNLKEYCENLGIKFNDSYIAPNRNLYTQEQDGCLFVSFDMKKANFQILKRINPNIVKNAETYEDFIGAYTDLDYIKESKYARQVIFGKMNPKRVMTVEKNITNNFASELDITNTKYELFSLNSDEIILKFNGTEDEFANDKFGSDIEYCGIKYRFNKFKLHLRQFQLSNSESILDVYEKEDYLNGHKRILKGVPATYFPQVYKLLNDIKIVDSDLVFYYEHELCKFLNPLKLIK